MGIHHGYTRFKYFESILGLETMYFVILVLKICLEYFGFQDIRKGGGGGQNGNSDKARQGGREGSKNCLKSRTS